MIPPACQLPSFGDESGGRGHRGAAAASPRLCYSGQPPTPHPLVVTAPQLRPGQKQGLGFKFVIDEGFWVLLINGVKVSKSRTWLKRKTKKTLKSIFFAFDFAL